MTTVKAKAPKSSTEVPAKLSTTTEAVQHLSDYVCLLGEIHFPVKVPVAVADRYVVESASPVTKSNVIYVTDLNDEERVIILNQDGYNHPILRTDISSINACLKTAKATYKFEIIEPTSGDGSDLSHYDQSAFAKISSFVASSPIRSQRYSKVMAYFRSVVK
jgi:hypothetical protein